MKNKTEQDDGNIFKPSYVTDGKSELLCLYTYSHAFVLLTA